MYTFDVKRRQHTIHVRLLPTIREVHRALTPSGRARDGKITHAFFQGNATNGNGCIVLPMERCSPGLIGHEVTHAALHWLRVTGRCASAQEALEEEQAQIVEHFTDRIWARVVQLRAGGNN